jgi:thiamine biosynthesis protein ThiS
LIKVNKEDMEYQEGMTIEDILRKKKYTFRMITVIVNGRVIPKDQHSAYRIMDGDNVDVVHIMSGG